MYQTLKWQQSLPADDYFFHDGSIGMRQAEVINALGKVIQIEGEACSVLIVLKYRYPKHVNYRNIYRNLIAKHSFNSKSSFAWIWKNGD